MKKNIKLSLDRETISRLTDGQAKAAQGGIATLEGICSTEGACIPASEWHCERSMVYCTLACR